MHVGVVNRIRETVLLDCEEDRQVLVTVDERSAASASHSPFSLSQDAVRPGRGLLAEALPGIGL